jgi:hypothetical protein
LRKLAFLLSIVAERKHFLASLNVSGAEDMEKRLKAELEENGVLEPDDENVCWFSSFLEVFRTTNNSTPLFLRHFRTTRMTS